MKNSLLFIPFSFLMTACGSNPTDLCPGKTLDVNSLTGEWTVSASATGSELGYTYIFDQGLLKKITADLSYTEMYDVNVVGGTLNLVPQGSGEANTYCVASGAGSLVLTQVLSEAVRKEVEAAGNTSFGHAVYTLQKVGS